MGDLLADQCDLVVTQSLLVEPVRARDLLEGVDGGLNPLSPSDRDELDVSMDVADGEHPLAARLEIGIDGDAAVLVQTYPEPLEGLFGREESDLHDRERTVDGLALREREA